jgi:hypothetical protein
MYKLAESVALIAVHYQIRAVRKRVYRRRPGRLKPALTPVG